MLDVCNVALWSTDAGVPRVKRRYLRWDYSPARFAAPRRACHKEGLRRACIGGQTCRSGRAHVVRNGWILVYQPSQPLVRALNRGFIGLGADAPERHDALIGATKWLTKVAAPYRNPPKLTSRLLGDSRRNQSLQLTWASERRFTFGFPLTSRRPKTKSAHCTRWRHARGMRSSRCTGTRAFRAPRAATSARGSMPMRAKP